MDTQENLDRMYQKQTISYIHDKKNTHTTFGNQSFVIKLFGGCIITVYVDQDYFIRDTVRA